MSLALDLLRLYSARVVQSTLTTLIHFTKQGHKVPNLRESDIISTLPSSDSYRNPLSQLVHF